MRCESYARMVSVLKVLLQTEWHGTHHGWTGQYSTDRGEAFWLSFLGQYWEGQKQKSLWSGCLQVSPFSGGRADEGVGHVLDTFSIGRANCCFRL